MASADIEVQVAVEAAIHQAIRTFIEQVQVEHGLRITGLNASWLDASTVARRGAVIDVLRIEMES